VRIETGGAAEESEQGQRPLSAPSSRIMGATMILLLMIQLQNLPAPCVVLATAPLGLIGAVAALLVADAAFGFVALLGLIALAGMIMRNTIILVDQVRQDQMRRALACETPSSNQPSAAPARWCSPRWPPSSPSSRCQHRTSSGDPMALTMIGGLLGATILTLASSPPSTPSPSAPPAPTASTPRAIAQAATETP
jgi:multidrug efflux pump subunit AcrB